MVTYPGPVAGLRERRHRETKQALVDAAFQLFAERGFAAVTMDEIAMAAGVSRSTAYRRFLTKEDLVLEMPRQWLDVFDEAVASLESDASLDLALRTACRAVASHIDGDRVAVLAAFRVLEDVPSLRSTGVATSAWLERMISLVERYGAVGRGSLDSSDAGTIGGAYLGAIDAMMQRWAMTGGSTSVVDATERLLDRLAPILE